MNSKQLRRLNYSVLIFLVSLLLTFLLWDYYLNSNEPINRNFTANLVLFMGTLFSFAAGAAIRLLELRHDSLEEEVKKKQEELVRNVLENRKSDMVSAAIYQSAQILFSEPNLDPLLERVMGLMSGVLRADEGSVMLLDHKEELYIAASRGVPESIARDVHIKMGERVAGKAARERRDFLLVDGLENYPEFNGIPSNRKIKSSIVCPLVCQNKTLGVMNLNRTVTVENFTISDLIHASIFAAMVAQALHNSKLYHTLRDKSEQLRTKEQKIWNLEKELGLK